jgi:hypothetical protein
LKCAQNEDEPKCFNSLLLSQKKNFNQITSCIQSNTRRPKEIYKFSQAFFVFMRGPKICWIYEQWWVGHYKCQWIDQVAKEQGPDFDWTSIANFSIQSLPLKPHTVCNTPFWGWGDRLITDLQIVNEEMGTILPLIPRAFLSFPHHNAREMAITPEQTEESDLLMFKLQEFPPNFCSSVQNLLPALANILICLNK